MRHKRKFPLWLLPVFGIAMGVAIAFVFIHGLSVTWQFLGNPSEKISQIIGFVGGYNLFVEAESGNVYSIQCFTYMNGRKSLPRPIEWKHEPKNSVTPDPERKPFMKFISLPLLFKVKQVYEMDYVLVEGEHLVKFALSEDGNLWMWNYGQGGLAGLTYIIFPLIGLILGSLLALVIKAGQFLWGKMKPHLK